MHSINIDLLTQDEARQRLKNAENPLEFDNSLVCGKAKEQRNNLCQVDVGGPLACDRGDGYYELVGVYSRDTGCIPTNQVKNLFFFFNITSSRYKLFKGLQIYIKKKNHEFEVLDFIVYLGFSPKISIIFFRSQPSLLLTTRG